MENPRRIVVGITGSTGAIYGIRLLEAFPAICHGVDVGRLRRDATAARARLLELGPDGLGRFEAGLIPRVHLVDEP